MQKYIKNLSKTNILSAYKVKNCPIITRDLSKNRLGGGIYGRKGGGIFFGPSSFIKLRGGEGGWTHDFAG